MRKYLAFLLLLTQFAFSGEFIIQTQKGELRLNSVQLSLIADNIDNEILRTGISQKNATLTQISSAFRELSDDAQKDSKKSVNLKLKSLLLKISKGLTATSVHSARPFMASIGFVNGFFEKTEKNLDSFNFLSFYLNHSDQFDDLYKRVDSLEDYQDETFSIIEDIIVEKIRIITQDSLRKLLEKSEGDDSIKISTDNVLTSLGIRYKLKDINALSIAQIAQNYIGDFNISYYSPNLINEHPEYQEVRSFLGDFSADDLNILFMSDDLDSLGEKANNLDFEAVLAGAKISILEGIGAFSAQLFIPKIVLGAISKSVGNIVFVPLLVADLGYLSSALVCGKNKNVEAAIAAGDEQLKNFCNYTLINSAYIMSRSKARGYVKGKKSKVKFLNFTRKIGQKLKRKKKQDEQKQVM